MNSSLLAGMADHLATLANASLARGDASSASRQFAAALDASLSGPPPPPLGARIAPSDVHGVCLRARCALGMALSSAALARGRDPSFSRPSTAGQLLACLRAVAGVAEHVVSLEPAAVVREGAAHVLHNAALSLLALGEPLLARSAALAARVAPLLAFAVLCVECTPPLAAPRHLPLRTRLYAALCRAYDAAGVLALPCSEGGEGAAAAGGAAAKGSKSAGGAAAVGAIDEAAAAAGAAAGGAVGANVHAARSALRRGEATVGALARMLAEDPPVLEADGAGDIRCLRWREWA